MNEQNRRNICVNKAFLKFSEGSCTGIITVNKIIKPHTTIKTINTLWNHVFNLLILVKFWQVWMLGIFQYFVKKLHCALWQSCLNFAHKSGIFWQCHSTDRGFLHQAVEFALCLQLCKNKRTANRLQQNFCSEILN